MAGPTFGPGGLQIQTADEIRADLVAEFESAFGASIQAGSGDAVIGQITSAMAQALRPHQEGIDAVYQGQFLDGAADVGLDRYTLGLGIARNSATATTVAVSIANASGADVPVPQGVVAQLASTGALFAIVTGVTSPAGGSVAAVLRAVEPGPITVGAGAAWSFVQAFAGSSSLTVTNAAPGETGTAEETDGQERLRVVGAAHLPAKGTVLGIQSALADLDGVTYARVFENTGATMGITAPVVIPTLPSKAFVAVVAGGTNAAIGEVIHAQKIAGMEAWGATPVTVTDSDGYPATVHFEDAQATRIYVAASVYGALAFEDAIKAAIVAYVAGLTVGGTIVRVKLEAAIVDAAGPTCRDIQGLVFAATLPPLNTANLTLPWNRYPAVDPADIDLTMFP